MWISACDEVFEPWQVNDQYHFSIYGFLDASADTQWVRVAPVRESLFTDPDAPFEGSVWLEDVETGESTEMNGVLIGYAHGNYAWNFWSDRQLLAGRSYRVRAVNESGEESYSEVRLPEDFPVPVMRRVPRSQANPEPSDFIYLEGVERLADVQTVYYFDPYNVRVEYTAVFPHLQDTARQASGEYVIELDPRADRRRLQSLTSPVCDRVMDITWDCVTPIEEDRFEFNEERMTRISIYIASAGPDYLHFSNVDEKIVELPEGISNVVNGTGYLAGIVSKTIPYESCTDEFSRLIPCEPAPYPWLSNLILLR
ncbi:MAG: hypothetical protein WD355_11765 [Balneolaceae bacterium]